MRILRLHGISKDAWKRYSDGSSWEYDVIEAGYKYNTTDINSAMGIEQLKKIEFMWGERKRIADRYNRSFANEDGVILYQIKEDRESAWHLYPIKLNIDILNISRNNFINEMSNRGIKTSVHFIPLYRFSYYKKMGFSAKYYPESEWVFERTFSLPIYPGMRDDEIDYVIECVLGILRYYKR